MPLFTVTLVLLEDTLVPEEESFTVPYALPPYTLLLIIGVVLREESPITTFISSLTKVPEFDELV